MLGWDNRWITLKCKNQLVTRRHFKKKLFLKSHKKKRKFFNHFRFIIHITHVDVSCAIHFSLHLTFNPQIMRSNFFFGISTFLIEYISDKTNPSSNSADHFFSFFKIKTKTKRETEPHVPCTYISIKTTTTIAYSCSNCMIKIIFMEDIEFPPKPIFSVGKKTKTKKKITQKI